MKNYVAIEITMTSGGRQIPGSNEDFGRQAAVAHRIAKASWVGQAPFQREESSARGKVRQVPTHSKLLGEGSFKSVYETPEKGAPQATEFVLAKLDCAEAGHVAERVDWSRVKNAVDDVVKTMVLHGIPRMTIFVRFDFFLGETRAKLAVYLPRCHGTELEDVVSGKAPSDENLRIRYFLQLCHQIRELHTAGYYHSDLKPANVMADPVRGVSLIDFGGVRRVWQATKTTTASYSIIAPDYAERLPRVAGRAKVALPAALTNAVEKARRLLGNANATLKAAPMKAYARKTGVGDIPLGLYGAAFDTAALMMIALELKLFDAVTIPLFTKLAEENFHPRFLQPILAHFESMYAGADLQALHADRLSVLTTVDGVTVNGSTTVGIDPESVAVEVERRFREQLAERVARSEMTETEADARAQGLGVVDDAFKLHRSLVQLTRLYKRKELIDGGSVDTKRRALTGLIDSLTFAADAATLHGLLLKLFVVSLVNTGMFSTTYTESFNVLFAWVKNPTILPLVSKYFDATLKEDTKREDFHGRVLAAASVLDASLGVRDAYKTKNRFGAILAALGDAPGAGGPRDRTAARSAAHRMPEDVRKQLLRADGAVATYAIAKGGRGGTEKTAFADHVAGVAASIESAFGALVGTFDKASFVRFQKDIAEAYAPPP
jgi:hypothetical protein